MEAIGSPNDALKFGLRQLRVRVDVQAPAARRIARELRTILIAAVRGLAGACQPAAETQVLSLYGEPIRRAPAASRKVRQEQGGKRRRLSPACEPAAQPLPVN